MAVGITYEQAKKKAWGGFFLLLIVTLAEVFIALLGNGHIIDGFTLSRLIMYPAMIILSLYKAYYIVKEFMHMGYELKGLVLSVVLPFLLLIWAVIAFLWEGAFWHDSREFIKEQNELAPADDETGFILRDKGELPEEIYFI
ncbi:MAG: cytochrome C oxidase subunit IV family protein [Bacteroidota bacterium]